MKLLSSSNLEACFRGYILYGVNFLTLKQFLQVQNCYKIKDPSLGTKTPAPKPKDVLPRQQHAAAPFETVKDVADSAAYRVAEAENKSFLAAEAVKEADRISKLAEDAESMLQLVKEIYEQCNSSICILIILSTPFII